MNRIEYKEKREKMMKVVRKPTEGMPRIEGRPEANTTAEPVWDINKELISVWDINRKELISMEVEALREIAWQLYCLRHKWADD